jgi:hypothetical protein
MNTMKLHRDTDRPGGEAADPAQYVAAATELTSANEEMSSADRDKTAKGPTWLRMVLAGGMLLAAWTCGVGWWLGVRAWWYWCAAVAVGLGNTVTLGFLARGPEPRK